MDESWDEDGGTVIRSRVRDERGATAVEFAFVMVPLLIILFGIIQYAFYFWSMQGGADAARAAARLAATGEPSDCTAFRNIVKANLGAVTSDPSGAVITRTYTKGTNPTTHTFREPGDEVTVTVRFDGYDFNLPFVPFVEDAEVKSSAKARVDYVVDDAIGDCT